jgi:hypothetical protein
MTEKPISPTAPTPEELRTACQTLLGMPGPNPELAAKLRYVAELLADAGPLPPLPLLVWREADQKVRHAVIQGPLVVGRASGPARLAFPEDRLLSREHFSLSLTEDGCLLRNLKSKNGTSINNTGQTVGERLLRDGDLILAGNHIFAFLDQAQVA